MHLCSEVPRTSHSRPANAPPHTATGILQPMHALSDRPYTAVAATSSSSYTELGTCKGRRQGGTPL